MQMPTPTTRPLDEQAVARQLRRLALAPAPRVPWLHEEVSRRMAERLAWIKRQPEQVSVWWPQPGGGLEALQGAYPSATLNTVWPDARWRPERPVLPWWRQVLGGARAARTEGQQVLASDPLPTDQDLVWSNMVLHWAVDPLAMFERWSSQLGAHGFLMFSTLGPGTLRELFDTYAAQGWAPPAAEFVDMHDLGDMLGQAGFADPVVDQETLRLTYPDAEAALAELRTWGGNASPDRFPGWRGRQWRSQLLQALNHSRDHQGKVVLSIEVVYGHAFKGLPRQGADGVTSVSLSDMRSMLRKHRTDGTPSGQT